jgi:hypothetical protein
MVLAAMERFVTGNSGSMHSKRNTSHHCSWRQLPHRQSPHRRSRPLIRLRAPSSYSDAAPDSMCQPPGDVEIND